MALGNLPSWLHASPELYLHAITSGSQAGRELARIAQEADNAAAARSLAQQRLAQEATLANERLAYLEQAGEENRDVARERIGAQREIGAARESRLGDEHADTMSVRQAALELARQKAGDMADYRDARLTQMGDALELTGIKAEDEERMREWRRTNPSLKDASFVSLRQKGMPGRPDMLVRGNLKDPIDRASLRAAYGTNSIPSILQESNYVDRATAPLTPPRVAPQGTNRTPITPNNRAAVNLFNYNAELGDLEELTPP